MIGKKLYKNSKNDMAQYTATAIWCNKNNAMIVDKGDYYEVVAITDPTIEEQLAQLDADYNRQKSVLSEQYTSAMMADDIELADEVKAELTALNEWYDEEYEKIVGGE